ncbi:MAG TPA: hypothetical protein DCY13_01605 [Verrucomicrobiales bacterium]|nr:hypothetical protein [Verrucomicrobiales bacterium]
MHDDTMRFKIVLLCLLTAPAVFGQGTIVYHNPADIHLFGNNGQHDLDVDHNGTIDYRLTVGGSSGFAAFGQGRNASMAVLETPPDVGGSIVPATLGEPVGPGLEHPRLWYQNQIVETFPGQFVTVPASFHGCVTTGCVGQFHNITAYWGVRFDIDGNDHYGWVRVATPGGIRNGGTILDWAYNSVPGQPILAGQVPEPATWALLLGGGAMLHLYRRRRLDGKQ